MGCSSKPYFFIPPPTGISSNTTWFVGLSSNGCTSVLTGAFVAFLAAFFGAGLGAPYYGYSDISIFFPPPIGFSSKLFLLPPPIGC